MGNWSRCCQMSLGPRWPWSQTAFDLSRMLTHTTLRHRSSDEWISELKWRDACCLLHIVYLLEIIRSLRSSNIDSKFTNNSTYLEIIRSLRSSNIDWFRDLRISRHRHTEQKRFPFTYISFLPPLFSRESFFSYGIRARTGFCSGSRSQTPRSTSPSTTKRRTSTASAKTRSWEYSHLL